ncbi:MAG TPA: ribosome assembly factor SBDS [Methanomassiliicoccales archaeon]|nr:ribosome assembly factor SBDS [Methanomassiliicoccales archaeon]HNX47113.1 ribosome assembly factor SBDS [Methanomassiliicoccales archaeon]HPR97889.1 ribosome assembly factor SBDS [Methanomassiliicoccales archaeon]
MVDLDEAIVARLESHGETFEVLIDPKVVNHLKEGKEVELIDYMVIDEIFKNAHKGTRASEDKLKEVFGTLDAAEIAKVIIIKGEVQLTAQQRKEMLESKRLRIIATIARNAINPQTGGPHTPARIEMAMEEAKVHIDAFKPVDVQVQQVMDKLRPLIPIRFDTVRIAVKLKADEYGRCYDDMKEMGKITNEEWQKNGDWIGVVEIPAGLRDDLFHRLNAKTHGEVETKQLKK